MSGNEIMVAVVFVLLGYWIVSAFLNRKPNPQAQEPQPGTQTWHQVLNIDANASVEEIRAAYEVLMSQYQFEDRKSKEIGVAYREAMRSRGGSA